jgi:pimeloyl-ACP methyl ester carboxylesterase
VRYEELVSAPERVMRGVCEFLGVRFEPSLLDPYGPGRMLDGVHPESLPVGDPDFLSHQRIESERAGSWRQIDLGRPLAPQTRHEAEQLEYPLREPAAGAGPAARRERFVEAASGPLCVCEWGEAARDPLLLVHGMLDQGAAWQLTALHLEQQFHVLAPDLRGHGRSASAAPFGPAMMEHVADLERLLSSADRPSHLVGHSLGAIVAGIVAALRPELVRTLVLVEGVLPRAASEHDLLQRLSRQLDHMTMPAHHPRFPDLSAAAARLRDANPSLPLEFARELAARVTVPAGDGVTWSWDPNVRSRYASPLELSREACLSLFAQVTCPVLLVFGDASRHNRPADLEAQRAVFETAETVVLTGAHNLHVDAPEQLAHTLSAWAARAPSRARAARPRAQASALVASERELG